MTSAQAFAESVRGVTARHWGDATAAPSGDLAGLWTAGAAQGWFDLGAAAALGEALAAVAELGRAACPLPVMDGYAAARLLRPADDGDRLAGRIAAGDLRVLIAVAGPEADRVDFAEAAGPATHVLTLPAGGEGPARLRPITGRVPQPGLAVPSWSAA
ncbi:MAG: acyl-CoA dehydrogenase family protein, partial [Streptosporangiaceae bacterium]